MARPREATIRSIGCARYQRGVLATTGGFGNNGGGSVTTPIGLPNTDTQRSYDLDGLGNWRRTVFTPEGGAQETEVRQHNGLNEINRIQNGASQTNLSYDGAPGQSNGNLKNDGVRSYAWDALNRLVQVKRVSDNAIIGQYVYDALNRRIRKTIPNLSGGFGGLTGDIPAGTTDCIYAGWRCVEERNPFGGGGSTDTPTAQYVWGIYLDECLQQRLIVGINDFANNSFLYPLQDLLYRTTGLADSSGTVREAYDTDAYGNTLIFRNAGSPPAAIAWTDGDTQVHNPTCPFIFTGQRYDAEAELYYYKRRYYLPSIGRCTARDPVGYISSLNLFQYVACRPEYFTDPLGLNGTQHHWFNQRLDLAGRFTELCAGPLKHLGMSAELFMHLFTTFDPGHWGKGSIHYWIHSEEGGDYDNRVADVYDSASSCCELLTKMVDLIHQVAQEATGGGQGLFPKLKMYNSPPGASGTTALLSFFIDNICHPPCFRPMPSWAAAAPSFAKLTHTLAVMHPDPNDTYMLNLTDVAGMYALTWKPNPFDEIMPGLAAAYVAGVGGAAVGAATVLAPEFTLPTITNLGSDVAPAIAPAGGAAFAF